MQRQWAQRCHAAPRSSLPDKQCCSAEPGRHCWPSTTRILCCPAEKTFFHMIIAYSALICASKQLLLPKHGIVLPNALALLVSLLQVFCTWECTNDGLLALLLSTFFWSEQDCLLIGAVETMLESQACLLPSPHDGHHLPHAVLLYVCRENIDSRRYCLLMQV